MSRLILPARFNQQPQQPLVIDWSNPLTQGLLSAWTNNQASVNRGSSLTTGGTRAIGYKGIGVSFNGTSDSVTVPSNSLAHAVCSRYAVIKVGSASGTRTMSGGGASTLGFRLNTTSIEVVQVGVVIIATVTSAVAASEVCSVGVAVQNNIQAFYKNGRNIGNTTASVGVSESTTPTIGQAGNSSSFFDGTIYLHLAWNRILNDGEMASLDADPWQIFRAPRRALWVAVPSSGTTLAITGNSSTTAVGSVVPSMDMGATGNSSTTATGNIGASDSFSGQADGIGQAATGSVGSLVPSMSIGITGAAGASAVGSVSQAAGLSGNVGTGSAGSVAEATALTGNAATSAAGSVTYGLSVGLTGVAGTSAVGTLSQATGINGNIGTGSAGSVAEATGITGNSDSSAVGSVSYSLTVAITGDAATGIAGTVAVAGSGNITLAISGNGATTAVGSVGIAFTVGSTGDAATGAVGSAGAAEAIAVTANVAAAAVGFVTLLDSIGLSGAPSTGSIGVIYPITSTSGVNSVAAAGTPGVNIILPLSSVSGISHVGQIAPDNGNTTHLAGERVIITQRTTDIFITQISTDTDTEDS